MLQPEIKGDVDAEDLSRTWPAPSFVLAKLNG